MTRIVYNKTHRMLEKATDDGFGYHVIEIDIYNGMLKRYIVKCSETLIRVKEEIFGEKFCATKTTILSKEQVLQIEIEFNEVRVNKGWTEIKFRIE